MQDAQSSSVSVADRRGDALRALWLGNVVEARTEACMSNLSSLITEVALRGAGQCISTEWPPCLAMQLCRALAKERRKGDDESTELPVTGRLSLATAVYRPMEPMDAEQSASSEPRLFRKSTLLIKKKGSRKSTGSSSLTSVGVAESGAATEDEEALQDSLPEGVDSTGTRASLAVDQLALWLPYCRASGATVP